MMKQSIGDELKPIRFGILTVSDRSYNKQREDLSGPALVNAVLQKMHQVVTTDIVPDDRPIIAELLKRWINDPDIDVILTTGGTGFAPRDVTPEATLDVIEKQVPGLGELMRAESYKINRHAMLSRTVAGIKDHVLIINLPGSPKAAVENFEIIADLLPHAVDLLRNNPASEDSHILPPS